MIVQWAAAFLAGLIAFSGFIFYTKTPVEIRTPVGSGGQTISQTTTLTDIGNLTPTDSNIIVGDGTTWVAESGATARTSLGLGTGDSPTFTGLTATGLASLQGGFISNASSTIGSILNVSGALSASSTFSAVSLSSLLGGFISSASSSISSNLHVLGNLSASSTITVAGASTASSTFASAIDTASILEADRIITISSTASSTFASGINLTAGCFAVNGACVGGGTATNITTNSGFFRIEEQGSGETLIAHGLGATPARVTFYSEARVCDSADTSQFLSTSFGTATGTLKAETYAYADAQVTVSGSLTTSSSTDVILHNNAAGGERRAAYVSTLNSTNIGVTFRTAGQECSGIAGVFKNVPTFIHWTAEE